MNERIKKLKEQAGEYVNSVYTPPVRSKTPGKIWEDGHIGWHTQFNEKFAELIVAECVEIVERYGTPDGYYIADEINRIMLNIRTDKPFGVEE